MGLVFDRDIFLGRGDMLVVASQSGETAHTLAALREAARRGGRTVAITNVVDSSVARDADEIVRTRAGPEIAVASTKAYTAQLLAFVLLAPDIADHADEVIRLPETHPLLAPILAAIPLQLIAYHTAVARGCDVDNPRNPAESVTVE